jgi:DNA mismatch endonuclease (patch repair protein)
VIRAYKPKQPEEIRRNMSAIRSKDTKTETKLRKSLFAIGLRYRKNLGTVPGRPDIVFPSERIAVFVDGDYWHGRVLRERGIKHVRRYYTNKQQTYWVPKLKGNVARDEYINTLLKEKGWMVIRMWESDVARNVQKARDTIAKHVMRRKLRFRGVRQA